MEIKIWVLSGILTIVSAIALFLFQKMINKQEEMNKSIHDLRLQISNFEIYQKHQEEINRRQFDSISKLFMLVENLKDKFLSCKNCN